MMGFVGWILFIFINRRCTSMKILHMECGGLVIYHMKLESGSFTLPEFDAESHTFKTNWQGLMTMAKGVVTKKNSTKQTPVDTF